MTERENFMLMMNGEKPEWIPCFYSSYDPVGSSLLNNQGEYMKGGKDMFGVEWICTPDTGYQAIADPRKHLLEEMEGWQDVIHFPDVDEWDWETAAKNDLARTSGSEKVLCCFGMEGNFNRLESILGIENAMMAMIEEPEEVLEFFKAHTDWKCKTIEKLAKYYKPDIYVNGDDVCSSSGLMISPNMYNTFIKPFEMQIGETVTSLGIRCEHHVCGLCENIIPDIIETGATVWQTAQSMNDIPMLQKKYGRKLLIHGGWDSFGEHNFAGASEDSVRAEVRRCIDTYINDGFYALFPIVMGDPESEDIKNRRAWVVDECQNYSAKVLKNI